MRFMNEYEIDDAAHRFRDHSVLGPATQTLSNLRDATNSNSDGWPYWPKPARAAARLMELIERGSNDHYRGRRPEATVAEYRKALVPMKSFRTRYPFVQFEIVEASG